MIPVNLAIKRLLQRDSALEPHQADIRLHLDRYNAALKELAGKKPLTEVANGHLYYGFHRTECFPMDVWMKRAKATLLPDVDPTSFGKDAGIAQQYIFHYSRMHPELFEEK